MQHLDFAYASSLIRTFLEDEYLFLTIRGRKYSGKGHTYRRITRSEEGRSRTKSISEKNIGWIKEATKNYRNFRERQKKIKEYEQRLKKLLDKHSKEITEQTRMKKEYN